MKVPLEIRGSRLRAAFVAAVVLCSACLITPPTPPPVAVVHYPLGRATLPNGARVVAETAPDFGIVGVVVVVRAGSGDETAEKAGLAHLVEHLVFRAQHGGGRLEQKFQALGAAAWNGSTTWDETTVYAFVPSKNLSALLELMAQVLDDPLASIDDAAFAHEQQIVRNEERLRTEPGTPGQAWGLLSAEVFPPGHPYAHSTLGTDRSLDGLTLTDARAFVAAHYRPANVTLVVSSPLPFDSEIERVRTAVAGHSWATQAEAPGRTPRASEPDPFGRATSSLVTRELPGSTPTLWIGWPIPSGYGPDADRALMLSQLVPEIFWFHLRDRNRDIASVGASVQAGTDASMFVLEVTLNEGGDPKASADSAVLTMQKGFSELTLGTFEAEKRFGASRSLNGEEDMVSRVLRLATSADLAEVPTYLQNRGQRIVALQEGDVLDFERRYLSADRARVMFTRSPTARSAAADPPKLGAGRPFAEGEDDRYGSSPEIAELRSWMQAIGLADARRTTLDDGLEVIALRRAGSQFNTAVLGYHGGQAAGSPPGVATASKWALQRIGHPPGVWGISHESQIDEDLTKEVFLSLGSDIGFTLRQVDWGANFSISWPPPQFLDRLKSFELEDRQPAHALARKLRAALFGPHPYGSAPTIEDIHRIRPNDVHDFLNSIRRPENGVLALVGDFDPTEAFALASRELHQTSFAKPPLVAPPALERAAVQSGSRLVVQPRRNSSNTDLTFLCLLPEGDADALPADQVFGKLLGTDLRSQLRERLAASYGVTDQVSMLRGGTTLLTFHTDLADERLAEALLKIRHFVETPAAEQWDKAALAQARANVAKGFNMKLASTERLAQLIVSLWNLGWPLDDRFPEKLLSVGLDDVAPPADHCRDNWVLGLLGDETRIHAALAGWKP